MTLDTMDGLIQALKRLRVETGGMACLGCGHERDCGVRGCAIIRKAVERLSGMEWICAERELPVNDGDVLLLVSGKPTENLTLYHAFQLGSYSTKEGWIIDMWPGWDTPDVSHWMPLPELPDEVKMDI